MINFQKIFQNYPVFSMYISIIVIWYFTEQNINPKIWGHRDRMVQLPMQSVPIITNVVSSNPAQ